MLEHNEYIARVAAIDESVIAWFAGWLCADGSIKPRDGGRAKISFVITDLDPLRRFSKLFGNPVNGPYPPSGLGKKDRFNWQLSGWRAAIVLERLRPWLSDRYRDRLEATGTWEPRGHMGKKLTPAQAAEIKAELAVGGHGTNRRLARQYGVSDALIGAIKAGRIWWTIDPEDPSTWRRAA